MQKFPRVEQRLALECKGRRELDCKTRPSSRDESQPSSGRAVAQWIKITLGITGDLPQEFTSTRRFGTSMSALPPPGAVVCSKGWVVRPLKRYVSWVQNVVRQFGPYPVWAFGH